MTGLQTRASITKPAGRRAGEYLRQLRTNAGMTLEEVGSLTGMSATKISRIENNVVRMPEPEELRALLATYSVSPVSLLIAIGYVDEADLGNRGS